MLRHTDRIAIEKALMSGHMGRLVLLDEVLDCIFETPEGLSSGGFTTIKRNLEEMLRQREQTENELK